MFEDLYSSVGEFTEGAWESISTGAQSALGDWAGGASEQTQGATSQDGQTQSSGTTAASTASTASTANTTKPAMLGLDNQTLLIGGGLLLVAVLLFK
jgi:hypothetical protein